MDISIENNSLDLEFLDKNIELNFETQTIYEKNHANLQNLDYESSGHTGFQKAGDYALKDDIPDVSNFATKQEIPDISNLATKDEIPDTSSFITNDIDESFSTNGSIYLKYVSSSVNDANSSRLCFGDRFNGVYSYLASNISGAFAFSKGNGNILVYPNIGAYNCLMSDCRSDLGRSDYKWKDLYLSGDLKDSANSIPISKIANKDNYYTKEEIDEEKSYIYAIIGDIESVLGGI